MSQVTYQIDPAHSCVSFSVRHMMITNVRGEFAKLSGTVAFDSQNTANSSIDVVIDATSISTRDAQRDTHLKSAEFFDVEKYPEIRFQSTGVAGSKVTGNLTLHGVTNEVTLAVEGPTPEAKDPWGNQRIGASATTKINRRDFGLNWNAALETGGVLVGDEVTINIDVSAVRQA